MFCKKGVLKNLAKFTGKELRWSLFFNKVSGLCNVFIKETQTRFLFSCEFCKILKNAFFSKHLRATASDNWKLPYFYLQSKVIS